MKKCGIYVIRNTINNKFYIGSSKDIDYRWEQHRKDLNKNKHHTILLLRAWNKYGSNVFIFDILEECEENSLIETEQKYLDLTKYSILKIYNTNLIAGKPPSAKGRKRSNETCAKLSVANKGKKHSIESRSKMSVANKGLFSGNKNPAYRKDIYTFYNIKTNDIFVGTQHDFKVKYDLSYLRGRISELVNGKTMNVCGWKLNQ